MQEPNAVPASNRFRTKLFRRLTWAGLRSGLDRRRVNERRNFIESYAVKNEPCLCKQIAGYAFSVLATYACSNNVIVFSFTGQERGTAYTVTSNIEFYDLLHRG